MQKYFVVEIDNAGNPENANVEVAVQEELAAYSLTQQQIQEELQILEAAAKTDKTGWFKRTGWLEFFKGRNLKHLVLNDMTQRFGVRIASMLTQTRLALGFRVRVYSPNR